MKDKLKTIKLSDVKDLIKKSRTSKMGDQVLLPVGIYNKPTLMTALYVAGNERRLGSERSRKIGMPVSYEPYPALLIRDSRVGHTSKKHPKGSAFDGCEFAHTDFIRTEELEELSFNGCILTGKCVIPVDAEFHNSIVGVHGSVEVRGDAHIRSCKVHGITAQRITATDSEISGPVVCSRSTLEHVDFNIHESYNCHLGVSNVRHSIIKHATFGWDSVIGENCYLSNCHISPCSRICTEGAIYDTIIEDRCQFFNPSDPHAETLVTTAPSKYAKIMVKMHNDAKVVINFTYVPVIFKGKKKMVLVNIEEQWMAVDDLKMIITKNLVVGKTYSIRVVTPAPYNPNSKSRAVSASKEDATAIIGAIRAQCLSVM